jgi:hypothetical protein
MNEDMGASIRQHQKWYHHDSAGTGPLTLRHRPSDGIGISN